MAYGMVLVGHLEGSPHNARIRRYVVDAGDGTALYIGDAVKSDGTVGALTLSGTTGSNETLAAVVKADNGDTLRGVVMGVDPITGVAIGSENLNRLYRPASTRMVISVCDDPKAIFMIQSNAAIALTKVGENSDIVYAAGSTATGLSGTTISASSGTSTAQLRILGVDNAPNNVPASATANMLVMINEHELASTTGV